MRLDFLHSHEWQVSLGRFAVLVAVALAIGFCFDIVVYALLVALFGYSLLSLFSLYQMQSWLRSRRRLPPPEDRGVWSDISSHMFTKLHAERSRKRRLVNLLRAFREGAAALPDGVVVLTHSRAVLWFNEAAARLLGLASPRDRGAHIENFLPVPVKSWLTEYPDEPLRDVASSLDEATRLSFRLIPYSRDHQLLVVRDVTPLARLEQVRRDFVANVSHELRTPLTVLHGYLEMLEPEVMPQLAPILADLRSQSRRMTQIVEDLLTLSRLEAQQHINDAERLSMRALLSTLKREADGLSQGRHRVDIVQNCDCDLLGSTDYLHSAFSNLVSNAVRYTPEGGRIEISWLTAANGGARFAVKDTGYGIPAEHLPRITERFYRVSTSRSRESGGTGLGLSIVKHVLQLHQARLEIESELGVGSTFSCVFGKERLMQPEPVHEEMQ